MIAWRRRRLRVLEPEVGCQPPTDVDHRAVERDQQGVVTVLDLEIAARRGQLTSDAATAGAVVEQRVRVDEERLARIDAGRRPVGGVEAGRRSVGARGLDGHEVHPIIAPNTNLR